MRKQSIDHIKLTTLFALICLLAVAVFASPAAAETTTLPSHTDIYVEAENSIAYDSYGNQTYHILFKSEFQGLNALHVSETPEFSRDTESFIQTGKKEGTFFLPTDGGKGYYDALLLMVAVNGTIPDDFRLDINSSGYQWEGNSVIEAAPVYENISYKSGALKASFTKDNFTYGPQIWRPAGCANYPIYKGQNMTDTENTFSLMFIDLNVGSINKEKFDANATIIDNGFAKVEYSFSNLNSAAAISVYGYRNALKNIEWTQDADKGGILISQTVPPIPGEPIAISVEVAPGIITVNPGKTQQFSATVYDQYNKPMNNVEISWSFTNPAIGEINGEGLFTSSGKGSGTIVASAGEIKGTASVTVANEIVDPGAMSEENGLYVKVSNENGARYDKYGNDTYFMQFGGGLNAMKITDVSDDATPKIIKTNSTTGTFYLTDTGGQGRKDNAILLLAVNGTIPDDFEVEITATGYRWTEADVSNRTFVGAAYTETFDKDDFLYTPQGWRPPKVKNIALYSGQDINTENDYKLMFIDLYTGIVGFNNDDINHGMLKVDYSFNKLETFATFNIYGWLASSNQAPGIIGWANNGLSGCYVTGEVPYVDSVAVTPSNPVLKKDTTYQFSASALNSTSGKVYNTDYEWSVTDPTVGTVTDTGLFTAVKAGTTELSVSAGGKTSQITVNVIESDPVLSEITLSPENKAIRPGKTIEFSAKGLTAEGYEIPSTEFTWTSSNATVGVIDKSGLFTSDKEGKTTITVSSGDITKTTEVTVSENDIVPSRIVLIPDTVEELYQGDLQQFTVTAYDDANVIIEDPKCEWSVSDNTIGTIDSDGLFTALKTGDTRITITIKGVTAGADITVGESSDWTLTVNTEEQKIITKDQFISLSKNESASYTDYTGKIWEGVSLKTIVGLVDDEDENTFNTELAGKGYTITIPGKYSHRKGDRDTTVTVRSTELLEANNLILAYRLDGKEIRELAIYDSPAGQKMTYWPLNFVGSNQECRRVSEITIDLPKIDDIAVSPDVAVLRAGEKQDFNATVYDQYDNVMDVTDITWSVEDNSIGTIDIKTGLFTSSKAGNTNITASKDAFSGKAILRVVPADHQPKTWYVDASGSGDYENLTDAVSAAYDWDVIVVKPGTYTENLVIDKFLTIKSEDDPALVNIIPADTHIDTITVSIDDVKISGLNVSAGYSSKDFSTRNHAAIMLNGVSGCEISDNIVNTGWFGIASIGGGSNNLHDNTVENSIYHIYLEDSSENLVSDNYVFSKSSSGTGIYAKSNSEKNEISNNNVKGGTNGIWFSSANKNTADKNTISDASTSGFRIDSSSESIITNNSVSCRMYAFYLNSAVNNLLESNTITDSQRVFGILGISTGNRFIKNDISRISYTAIYMGGAKSTGNIFSMNSFNVPSDKIIYDRDNTAQIWKENSQTSYSYNGRNFKNFAGNYWTGYEGQDQDGNGIGDTPFTINDANIDEYPLVKPHNRYADEIIDDGKKTEKKVIDSSNANLTKKENGKTEVRVKKGKAVVTNGTEIEVPGNGFRLKFETDEPVTEEGDEITGEVSDIVLETAPVDTMLSDLGQVSGAVELELNGIPDAAALETTIEKGAPEEGASFQIAATNAGLKIKDVAYSMKIVKTNLNNGRDIKSAKINMVVPKSWVDANGGINSVRIIRVSEEGTKEVLETIYKGTNGDNLLFEGVSPHGLSTFGLAAVTAENTPSPDTGSSSSYTSGGKSSLGIDSAEKIIAGEKVTFELDQSAVSSVSVLPKEDLAKIMITTEKGKKPDGADNPEEAVYQYIVIKDYYTTPGSIEMATIKFSVPETWMDDCKASPDKVKLLIYDSSEEEWRALSTVYEDTENGVLNYYADTDRFGYFAIFAEDSVIPDTSKTTEEKSVNNRDKDENTPDTNTNKDTTKSNKAPLLSGYLMVFGVIAMILSIAMVSRRK
ncbi:PGF-pre-PGF domain-containing protein [Methanoplanus sp. FWC-SCC4]|uniref:PGF-pre-PGF domain-containing protein n=1 Tax=Methanochimaera problematica TaxID=2609417 RepID=A0AA97FAG6_9EURY|nr:Ig-like domain-containing protein [Methanoplanus sp. FWC-SCC4]WOF15312.1 PGF-pre-PGF domain-containing protein [Methanoplanus sp. FWC-SCC4]